MWDGLGQASTVAQLVGGDVGGLISMIIEASATAHQNKVDCELLARRVLMITDLLLHLQNQETMQLEEVQKMLDGLDVTLREAHKLVTSCQERSKLYRFVMAGRIANKFKESQKRIDSYLLLFPCISHIDITRRLDQMCNIVIPTVPPSYKGSDCSGDTTKGLPSAGSDTPGNATEPFASAGSDFYELIQIKIDDLKPSIDAADIARKVSQTVQEFTLVEIAAATNNFAREIGRGGFGRVYLGMFPNGREVAIKRKSAVSSETNSEEEFLAEVRILSQLRHKHIVLLLGWCVEEGERLLVFEYMKNGSLYDHLHNPQWSSSPLRASWKMRVETLLGISRAIEYLHSYAVPPVIHRDIKPSNIVLGSSWVPRLTDFGLSLTSQSTKCREIPVLGTSGYTEPQYTITGNLKPTSDIYSLGVVMLEVLTGRKPTVKREEGSDIPSSLPSYALPLIEAGKLRKLLDKRPEAKPTPKPLEAADLVARTAARCVCLRRADRPLISEVVANLQAALQLVSSDS